MRGNTPAGCKFSSERTALVRPLILSGLLLFLASCSSVQEPLPPTRPDTGGGALIRGSVQTENHDITIATASAEPAAAGALQTLDLVSSRSVDEVTVHERTGEAPLSYVPNQVLVQYKPAAQPNSANLSTGSGLRVLASDRHARTALLELDPHENLSETLARLASDPSVSRATPNYYLHPTALPNDPHLSQQWALASTGVPVAWSATNTTTSPITVAVIDTGFDLHHEDLVGRFLPGYDFCANVDCTSTDNDPRNGSSSNWHGTHVAGVIAATRNNDLGISGVLDAATARLLPVKIFNDEGYGANTDVLIKALRWAAGITVEGTPHNAYPAQIINLSLAGEFPSEVLQDVLDEVRAAGTLVIASTGNAGVDRVMSPAAAEGVLGVGAINKDFNRSCFSNYGVGPHGPGGVDILAPGGEANGGMVDCGLERSSVHGLRSSIPDNRYGNAIGTSMAAPLVSATAALLLNLDPTLSVDQLEERLLGSAYFDSSYMDETQYGHGVLRADRALGFAGPGDSVQLRLTPEGEGEGFTAVVALELTSTTATYSFEDVPAGGYRLSAQDAHTGLDYGNHTLTLASGEERLHDITLAAQR